MYFAAHWADRASGWYIVGGTSPMYDDMISGEQSSTARRHLMLRRQYRRKYFMATRTSGDFYLIAATLQHLTIRDVFSLFLLCTNNPMSSRWPLRPRQTHVDVGFPGIPNLTKLKSSQCTSQNKYVVTLTRLRIFLGPFAPMLLSLNHHLNTSISSYRDAIARQK